MLIVRQKRAVARLYGLGTALPPHRASQDKVRGFMARLLSATLNGRSAARRLSFLERVYAGSGIATRHSVLSDYTLPSPARFTFFPRNPELEPFPSTEARMVVFEKWSVDLAEQAARRALREAGAKPSEVTHLVVATCTGLFAPGPDILLIERLGLRPDVRRSQIGFMGCYAGFTGLQASDHAVRAD